MKDKIDAFLNLRERELLRLADVFPVSNVGTAHLRISVDALHAAFKRHKGAIHRWNVLSADNADFVCLRHHPGDDTQQVGGLLKPKNNRRDVVHDSATRRGDKNRFREIRRDCLRGILIFVAVPEDEMIPIQRVGTEVFLLVCRGSAFHVTDFCAELLFNAFQPIVSQRVPPGIADRGRQKHRYLEFLRLVSISVNIRAAEEQHPEREKTDSRPMLVFHVMLSFW